MATKYFCDICRREVYNQEDLKQLHIEAADSTRLPATVELCLDCRREVASVIGRMLTDRSTRAFHTFTCGLEGPCALS